MTEENLQYKDIGDYTKQRQIEVDELVETHFPKDSENSKSKDADNVADRIAQKISNVIWLTWCSYKNAEDYIMGRTKEIIPWEIKVIEIK